MLKGQNLHLNSPSSRHSATVGIGLAKNILWKNPNELFGQPNTQNSM